MKPSYSATAEAYARDVVAGRIPAGKYIRLACQRHLDDLEWQGDDGFKFRFDPKKGARVCKFIESLPHTKGDWARRGEKLILQPWQIFGIMCLFGWLKKSNGLRRFRRAFWLVPRKNGKSAIAAGVGLYMLCADGEHGAEVYAGSTSFEQALKVFTPAKMMAQKSPQMRGHFGVDVNANNLHILETGSKFEPVIGKPGDGASPSCALIDEYHEHKTDALYSTMETGMGARSQPLILTITTAGFSIAGPCYAMQQDAQSMLEGSRRDDELFALIYGIDPDDDWTDPDVLRKANPNYGVSVLEENLISQQIQAMSTPRKASEFKTKHLNVWVQAQDAYFNVLRYQETADQKAGGKPVFLDDFEGHECIIGIDLAEKRDLTAVELLFRHDKGFARFGRYYLPEETIELPENEHLRRFRDEGRLIQTDGAVTDDREILEDILEFTKRFTVREIAFDPAHSRQMSVELMEQGIDCHDFANKPSKMNEPMRKLDALIADRQLHHDGDPMFAWMLSNVVNRTRTGDLHSPAKERAGNKIDGPVACIMALGQWLLDEPSDEAASPWDDPEFSLVM